MKRVAMATAPCSGHRLCSRLSQSTGWPLSFRSGDGGELDDLPCVGIDRVSAVAAFGESMVDYENGGVHMKKSEKPATGQPKRTVSKRVRPFFGGPPKPSNTNFLERMPMKERALVEVFLDEVEKARNSSSENARSHVTQAKVNAKIKELRKKTKL